LVFWRPQKPALCLVGDRITLRLPVKHDWQSWNNARVSSYELLQPVEPKWLEHMHERPSFHALIRQANADLKNKRAVRFLIVSKSANSEEEKILGGVNLSRLEWGAKRAGLISYWLCQSHQNQGYMREALTLVLDYAFNELNLNRLEAEVMERNTSSIRVLKHLNFQHEGRSIRNIKIAGQWQDHERYALLAPDSLYQKTRVKTQTTDPRT